MTKEELKQEVDRVKFEISKIEYVSDNPVLYNELHILLNKLNIMYEVISNPMVATSEEIDIYEENKGMKAFIYHITLHNDTKPIGYIRVSYDNKESIYGNIGYEIKLPYRGNNFTLKALEMLEETMINKGLTIGILVVHPSNFASIRVIEKFGAEEIEKKDNQGIYKYYQIDLLKKRQQNIKQKNKHL